MESRSLPVAALVVALLATPASLATWYAAGSFEPDTTWDAAGGRMWPGPDTNATSAVRLYFNAYDAATSSTSLNPNVGALGGRLAPPVADWQVLLGAWRDCNRDGYVGLAESALREYKSDLLPASTPCPVGSGTERVFNDGKWVTELLTIGAPDPCGWAFSPPPGCRANRAYGDVYYSNDTLVWGDLGAPDAVPGQGSDCTMVPLPPGTTSGTGHLLDYADCSTGHKGVATWNDADRLVDPTDSLHLRFEDPEHPQDSHSALNVHFPVNLWGNPTTGRTGVLQRNTTDPGFSVFDCDRGTEYHPSLGDPMNNRSLAPRVQNPTGTSGTGSYWDGFENTFEALFGDCNARDTPGVIGLVYVNPESGPSSVDTTEGRDRNNLYFTFYNGRRGTGVGLVDDAIGRRTPPEGGLGYHRSGGAHTVAGDYDTGPLWVAQTTYLSPPPLADYSLARNELTAQGGLYWSFFARVNHSDATRYGWILPASTSGTYGAESCGAERTGVHNGWVCDPAKWWLSVDGRDTMPYAYPGSSPGAPLAARIGELYDLRDVDCEDGRIAALPVRGVVPGDGVYAGLVQLSSSGYCK